LLISFSAIYTEVGISFKISHKILNLIREKLDLLNLETNDKKIQNKLKNRQYIGFLISTRISYKEINILEPNFLRKSKFVEIILNLPFIQYNENNYVEIFLDNLEIAIIKGLNKLCIENNNIKEIFTEVKREVIGNDNYKYIET
jgi:hypothetical protein